MKKSLLIFFLLLLSGYTNNSDATHTKVIHSPEKEVELYNLLMEYRQEEGLDSIPISAALSKVAYTHAEDLQNHQPDQGKCNMHSWSSNGDWSSCCYTDDHAKSECMWSKPKEITGYNEYGYEIAYSISFGGVIPYEALESWKTSQGHNDVILNKRVWKNRNWKAIGVGVCGDYAVVWFGEIFDE